MNTDLNVTRILCFGDSNTRGFIPGSGGSLRFDAQTRWTGILQNELGSNHEIIEEGLDARRIILEDPRPGFEGRNGLAYLKPCIESHKPLDLVILMLGTPDLKESFNLSAEEIVKSILLVLEALHQFKNEPKNISPKIILIAPPIIKDTADFASKLFIGGTAKNIELNSLLKEVSKTKSLGFVDASDCEVDQVEGVHLTAKGHRELAEKIKTEIKKQFPS